MKRAEVWRDGSEWGLLIYKPSRNRAYEARKRRSRVADTPAPISEGESYFPTHAGALAAALHEVGLTPTNPEEQALTGVGNPTKTGGDLVK